MADGRDLLCWDNHAKDCLQANREPFGLDKGSWLRQTLLTLPGVIKCLDIGCGPCFWIRLFTGFEYYAFDQSNCMLDAAKQVLDKTNLLSVVKQFSLGNARKLTETYNNEVFDLVFTSAVLQHNRHQPDKREIVQGMYNILKPQGYYLCTENTFREDNCSASVGFSDYTDGNSFTPKGWEKFMAPLGFELIEYNHPSEYLYKKI